MIEIQIPLWLVIVLLVVLAVALFAFAWLLYTIIKFGKGTNDDSLTDDDYENQSK
jgi:uncharacterized membrane protein